MGHNKGYLANKLGKKRALLKKKIEINDTKRIT